MRTIGLIGGMSWESTAEYYRLINQGVATRLGGLHSATCLLYSFDFAPIEELQRSGDWDALGKALADAASVLASAGADALVLCTNTMHKRASDIESAVDIPLLHIGDATAEAIAAAGAGSVTLLGTRFTMEESFLRDRIADRAGVDLRSPSVDDRSEVDRLIFEELVLGRVRGDAKLWFSDLLLREKEGGADGAILGCTELPMLVEGTEPPLPVFDTTALHAAAAVEFILSGDTVAANTVTDTQ